MSLERNVLLPMQGLIPLTYSLHSKRADILGRRIHLEGANDRQSESKIRGMTIAGHYGDEITLWPESYFAQSLARMSEIGRASCRDSGQGAAGAGAGTRENRGLQGTQ